MTIDDVIEKEPGSKHRLIGWSIFYVILIAVALFAAFLFGQRYVTRVIPAGNIKLSVSKQHYALGEAVHFTIQNNFTSPIFVNNSCPQEPLAVYKWDGVNWNQVHDRVGVASCQGQSRQIKVAPQGTTTGSYALWKNLFNKPGLYRIVAVVNNYSGLPFADFEIMQPGKKDSTSAGTSLTSTSASVQAPSQTSGTSSNARKSRTISTNGGNIVVQYDSSRLYIISINPLSGFAYEKSISSNYAEITFKSSQSQIQVQLLVQNGQLYSSVQQENSDD